MNRRTFLRVTSSVALGSLLPAAGVGRAEEPAERRRRWLALAESLKPRLRSAERPAVHCVQPLAAPEAFLRWRMEPIAPAAALKQRLMRDGQSAIVDFGTHLTGRLTFTVTGEGRGVDSPVRLRITLGEAPAEVAESLDRYQGGLSRAWLQDEVINIDVLPATVQLSRRYAFRYVKFDVVATSPNFAVRLSDVKAMTLTSAGENRRPLPANTPEVWRRIDEVSLATLRDCMQTVFEDGPKRDRRLWIGDLRLQALTNYATFGNHDLVKRCLYLFAALPREDGLVAACVFEEPQPLRGHEYIIDYAALYAATVLDYAQATGDWETARDLWPVVRRQMEILGQWVGNDGLFAAPPGSWVFIDWRDGLDHQAAMHGVMVYSLRQAAELARKLGAEAERDEYGARISRMTAAARAAFLDPGRQLFVSGPARQVSWASQAWMVLAGIASPREGREALLRVTALPEAVRPGAPYLYHYFVEALLQCGLKREALDLIQSYWGSMVKAGADTFWEVYDPAKPLLSPYGDARVNSYCHAWSCTPAFLLRQAGLE